MSFYKRQVVLPIKIVKYFIIQQSKPVKSLKIFFIILGIIEAIVAIGALRSGLLMIIDPSGIKAGMVAVILKNSPFDDFLIPGIFLFVINGLGNLTGAILSFAKKKIAGTIGMVLGLMLVIWISAQVYWIGLSHILQPVFFVIGIIVVVLRFSIYRKLKTIK